MGVGVLDVADVVCSDAEQLLFITTRRPISCLRRVWPLVAGLQWFVPSVPSIVRAVLVLASVRELPEMGGWQFQLPYISTLVTPIPFLSCCSFFSASRRRSRRTTARARGLVIR